MDIINVHLVCYVYWLSNICVDNSDNFILLMLLTTGLRCTLFVLIQNIDPDVNILRHVAECTGSIAYFCNLRNSRYVYIHHTMPCSFHSSWHPVHVSGLWIRIVPICIPARLSPRGFIDQLQFVLQFCYIVVVFFGFLDLL